MKKIFIGLITFVFACTLVGCGDSQGGPEDGKPPVETDTPVIDPDPSGAEKPFTVSLVSEGEAFYPETAMQARWTATDGSGVSEPVDFENGVASIYGLDGDYTVTLIGVPEEYTYDPNQNYTSNDNKNIKIELYRLLSLRGEGSNFYAKVMEVDQLGAYRLTFTSPGQVYYLQYKPRLNGTYTLESLADVTAEEVNPRLDVYSGSFAYKNPNPDYTINDGGASGIFTKNFLYGMQIDKLEIGGVFPFTIRCDSRVEYPVSVDFIFKRNGGFDRNWEKYEMVIPTENFYNADGSLKQIPNFPEKTFIDCGNEPGNTKHILDGSYYGYSDPEKGGDGYYHVKNSDGSLSENLLYAKITQPNQAVDFMNDLVTLRFNGKDYTFMIRGYSGVKGFEGVDHLKDVPTYRDCVNSDGVYPVTQELKNFLFGFSMSSSYFFDGEGHAEIEIGLSSNDENQWLFGCGYYA